MRQCGVCGLEIRLTGKSDHSCLMKGAVRPVGCWLDSSDELLRECAKSQRRRANGKLLTATDTAITNLAKALPKGTPAVNDYLRGCTPEERHMLVTKTTTALARYVAQRIEELGGLSVHPGSRDPTYPRDLAAEMLGALQRYQQKLERLWNARLKHGHNPSNRYVWRAMLGPIRFAQFLQDAGRTSFDGLLKREIVAFLQANPTIQPSPVLRFTRFLDEGRPWKETRGRPAGRKGRKAQSLAPPDLFSPEQLKAFLDEVLERSSDQEYLLAWMVGRLGIPLMTAYRLTLDRIALGEQGRLVIRPAQMWLTLPRAVESRLKAVLDEHHVGWESFEEGVRSHRQVLTMSITELNTFGRESLKRQARKLRTSALFASMMKGVTDRVTLHTTTGASMPYLVKIETLLSVDMHRRVAPDVVKARNAVIVGDQDE